MLPVISDFTTGKAAARSTKEANEEITGISDRIRPTLLPVKKQIIRTPMMERNKTLGFNPSNLYFTSLIVLTDSRFTSI